MSSKLKSYEADLKKAADETIQELRDFYRPHQRVYAQNRLLNHITGELVEPERRVKQSFVAECDINNILKQYSATGQLRHISANFQQGAYQDLPDNLDFQEALNIVKEGEIAFASLPSKTRDRFQNDPSSFLEFLNNPENRDEAVKLGLVKSSPPAPAGSSPEPNSAGTKIPPPPAKPLT